MLIGHSRGTLFICTVILLCNARKIGVASEKGAHSRGVYYLNILKLNFFFFQFLEVFFTADILLPKFFYHFRNESNLFFQGIATLGPSPVKSRYMRSACICVVWAWVVLLSGHIHRLKLHRGNLMHSHLCKYRHVLRKNVNVSILANFPLF